MTNDNNEFPKFLASEQKGVPLGKALQDARVSANLSVNDVAKKLNLGVATIHDLENNLVAILDTQKYPTIYLRGYLANYAKLVELTELKLYPEYQSLKSVQKQKQTLKSPSLIIPRAKKRSKKLQLLLLLLIAVGAFAYIFQAQLFDAMGFNTKKSEPISGLTSESEFKQDLAKKLLIRSSLRSSQSEVTDSAIDSAIDSEMKNGTIEQENSAQSTPIKLNRIVTGSEESNVPISPPIEDDPSIKAVAGIVSSSLTDIDTNADLIDNNDPVDAASSEIETLSDGAPESLSLVFNGECWTEVFDATGERIAFGLYNKGRVLMLSGIAPFKLKLGDPSAVEIKYQDKIIKGGFTPRRSAQFSVPLS